MRTLKGQHGYVHSLRRFWIHQKVIIIIFLTEHNYLKRTVVVMGDYLTVTLQEDCFEEANQLKVL